MSSGMFCDSGMNLEPVPCIPSSDMHWGGGHERGIARGEGVSELWLIEITRRKDGNIIPWVLRSAELAADGGSAEKNYYVPAGNGGDCLWDEERTPDSKLHAVVVSSQSTYLARHVAAERLRKMVQTRIAVDFLVLLLFLNGC